MKVACHGSSSKTTGVKGGNKKILLMGNPNVGKSVVFSKLTGVHVDSSNYAGTTVDYTLGDISFGLDQGTIIDVPGVYSLKATSEAEKVAVGLLDEGADVIICVLDATHLERNLDLALQLKEYPIPLVYSLNLVDVAQRQGITIDVDKLAQELEAPVISTVAIKNIGLTDLIRTSMRLAKESTSPGPELTDEDRWERAREITQKVQTWAEKEVTFIEVLEDKTVQPWPGIPLAILAILLSLGLVVGGGKALRAVILLPLVRDVITPILTRWVSYLVPAGIYRNLLVGEFGILIIGIEWPFALILPYVFLFYIVFSFLEDSGYLPRIGVLADGVFRRMGIQGGNIVPLMLGYGCAVPAILGSRAANTHKERIMVATLVSFAVPCASQSAAFISLLGDRSIPALILVYLLSILTGLIVGFTVNKMVPGKSQAMLIEVPNLLMPDGEAFKKKLKMRMRHFLLDAEGPMLVGIVIASVIAETGILNHFSQLIGPLVEGWLGLPKEASLSLLLGIIRRELAVLPLLELNLNTLQLVVGSVIALFYLPCLSVFAVLAKEFSLRVALLIGVATTSLAFISAGLINKIGIILLKLI